MKEKLAFISDLHDAVIEIASIGWEAWAAANSSDPFFEQINARLLVLMSYYNQLSLTLVCQYMVSDNKVPDVQTVPSGQFWPYKQSARFSDNRGVIQKRVPEHIVRPRSGATVGAPGSWRFGTWEVFLKACECLKLQPAVGGNEDKLDGPMGRDKWFAEASGSGLFWLNYFMQMTLDYIYGPGKPNVWPFQVQTPPWCNSKKSYFHLSAYDFNGYADLGIVYFPPPGASYGSGLTLYVKIVPDDSEGDPGKMDQGYLKSNHASMNTDYEVSGEYSEVNLSPLPASWTAWPLTCAQHEDDPWLYQYLEFLEMDGDYDIHFFISSDLNFDEPEDTYVDFFGGGWG